MARENHIKKYGAEDFERYHAGNMSKQEMHVIEKAALDDPFLADALEGYAYTKTAVQDIDELKTKLLKKDADKKVIWFKRKTIAPLLKIAAILILFMGAGLLWYNNNNPAKEVQETLVADNKSVKEIPADNDFYSKSDSSPVAREEEQLSVKPAASAPIKQEIILTDKNSGNGKVQETLVADENKLADRHSNTGPLQANNNSYRTDSVNRNNISLNYKIETSKDKNIPTTLAGKSTGIQVVSKPAAPITLRGRVIDTKGLPIAYAHVINKKNNAGVVTDKDGIFMLPVNDSTAEVTADALNYETTTKELHNQADVNDLVLEEKANTINEVIVTSGYGTSKKKVSKSVPGTTQNPQRISITNAIPLNGWKEFYKYVNDSLKTMEELNPSLTGTEVLVSFDVNDKSEPIDISVEKSLCAACNEEAVRIIKNGPTWKLNKKRKKANAVIRF